MPNTTSTTKTDCTCLREAGLPRMYLLLNTGAILMRNEPTAQTMPCACYLAKLELFGLLISYAKHNLRQQKLIAPVYMNKHGCQDVPSVKYRCNTDEEGTNSANYALCLLPGEAGTLWPTYVLCQTQPSTTKSDCTCLYKQAGLPRLYLLLNTGAILMRNELKVQTKPCACYLVKLELFGLMPNRIFYNKNWLYLFIWTSRVAKTVPSVDHGCNTGDEQNQQHKPCLVLITWWSQNSLAYLCLMPNTTFCNKNSLHLFMQTGRAANIVPSVDHGHSLFILQGSAAYVVTELSVPVSCWCAACVEQDAKALATQNKTIQSKALATQNKTIQSSKALATQNKIQSPKALATQNKMIR